ncbi:comF family domain protein, partial [Vibrio cholerae HC-41A1]
MLLGTMT